MPGSAECLYCDWIHNRPVNEFQGQCLLYPMEYTFPLFLITYYE